VQLTLFKALRSVNMPTDEATTVVRSIESHIAVKVTEANKALEGKLDGMNIKINIMLGLTVFIMLAGIAAIIVSGISGQIIRP
jgi:hypothetical protein